MNNTKRPSNEESINNMKDFLELGLLDHHLDGLLINASDTFIRLRNASVKMVGSICEDDELFRLAMITAFDYLSTGGFVSDNISLLAREIVSEFGSPESESSDEIVLEKYLDKSIEQQFRLGALLLIHEADNSQTGE